MNSAHLRRRHRAERRFQWYGRAALWTALGILALLLGFLAVRGAPGFFRTEALLPVQFDLQALGAPSAAAASRLSPLRFTRLAQNALMAQFPDAPRREAQALFPGIASGRRVRDWLLKHPEIAGKTQVIWVPVSSALDQAMKARRLADSPDLTQAQRSIAEKLSAEGRLRLVWNGDFFTQGDSRQPEQAGFGGAIMGSLFTMLVCFAVALPLSVMTAVYLEEFARPGKLVDLVEVNLNNLAAVPSILFGLLGLAVYINLLGMPRSVPLVAGLTLALMALPILVISTRLALSNVPDSIRQAALALGASPVQVAWHHALPLSLPGIMTGAILALARVLGETAPLLMIGMVAFIADVPHKVTDPATVMPVEVYLWSTNPEAGFAEKTAAGILVLLAVMLASSAAAIYIRRRYEIRW